MAVAIPLGVRYKFRSLFTNIVFEKLFCALGTLSQLAPSSGKWISLTPCSRCAPMHNMTWLQREPAELDCNRRKQWKTGEPYGNISTHILWYQHWFSSHYLTIWCTIVPSIQWSAYLCTNFDNLLDIWTKAVSGSSVGLCFDEGNVIGLCGVLLHHTTIMHHDAKAELRVDV